MENNMEAPLKLKIDLPYNPAKPLLRIYPKDCESGYNKGTCRPIIIAALFTVAKLWKQPVYSNTDNQTKKMWFSYVDYRPKTNEIILLDMGHTLRRKCIQDE
jgi:hypothetical protein